MRALRIALVAAALSAAVGCAHQSLIPGTTVPDTEENRAILKVIEEYKSRLVEKNIDGLLILASPNYFEDGGTSRGQDDYNYDGLKQILTSRLGRVRSMRYEIQYKDVKISDGKAEVDAFLTGSFELAAETGERYRRINDHHRFTLERNQNGKWKFLSGM